MNLTVPERFWIWRRRRGMSETLCSIAIGCSRGTVRRIEAGDTWPGKWLPTAALPTLITAGEEVAVLRRRAGWTPAELGDAIGVCRQTVYRIEKNELMLTEAEYRSIGKAIKYQLKRDWYTPSG